MEKPRCPYCRVPFTPFNLRENDTFAQIVYSRVTIEAGLDPVGLRCSGNPRHEFGLKNNRLVEIEPKMTREHVPAPNPSFEERANDWLADLVFRWFSWMPLPKFAWRWLQNQLLYPWQVAESWYVVYDPNAPEMTPEEEERIRKDIEADRFGEGGEPEEPQDDFVSPYADMDDDWDRRQVEQDVWDAEDNDAESWAEHRADEEDRDHGTDFSDDDDSEDVWPWDEDDDSDEWDEDPNTANEPEPDTEDTVP